MVLCEHRYLLRDHGDMDIKSKSVPQTSVLREVFPAEATCLFHLHGRLKFSAGKKIKMALVRSNNGFCETSLLFCKPMFSPVCTPLQFQRKMWHIIRDKYTI